MNYYLNEDVIPKRGRRYWGEGVNCNGRHKDKPEREEIKQKETSPSYKYPAKNPSKAEIERNPSREQTAPV